MDARSPRLPGGSRGRGSDGAGGDVLSHRASPAVPSAQRGLTAVFGMGTGVSPALWPPATSCGDASYRQSRIRGGAEVRRTRRVARGAPGIHLMKSNSFMVVGTGVRGGTGQAARALSTARLHGLPRFHLPPINVVVSHGPSEVFRPGSVHLEVGFPLRCFQRLSLPDVATRRCPWRNSRYTRGQSVPVLSY